MVEERVDSWEQCKEVLGDIADEVSRALERPGRYFSPLLYRGQSNASWELTTTLERYYPEKMRVVDYFRYMERMRPAVSTFTGEQWRFNLEEARRWAGEMPLDPMPGFEYLAYLRHHSFPAPLLDWTESPAIAAFFAFRDPPPGASRVAIYVFCEHYGGGKARSSGLPSIYTLGEGDRVHPRHVLQQSHYTICTRFEGGEQYFARHDDAFNVEAQFREEEEVSGQDRLWKIDIPVSQRGVVLRELRGYNLNAFSLFGSTESLCESLAVSHLVLGPDSGGFSPYPDVTKLAPQVKR